jgi:hypothetical protein
LMKLRYGRKMFRDKFLIFKLSSVNYRQVFI